MFCISLNHNVTGITLQTKPHLSRSEIGLLFKVGLICEQFLHITEAILHVKNDGLLHHENQR